MKYNGSFNQKHTNQNIWNPRLREKNNVVQIGLSMDKCSFNANHASQQNNTHKNDFNPFVDNVKFLYPWEYKKTLGWKYNVANKCVNLFTLDFEQIIA